MYISTFQQNGVECRCGNSLPTQGSSYTCDMGCSGNAEEMCGSDTAVSLYQTNTSM